MRFCLLLLALAAGCHEPASRELMREGVAVARKDWDGVLLELGSPRALPHLSEHGWSHGETAKDGNTFRWAIEEEASFTFESPAEGKRLAWLECEPFLYEGSPAQWIRLRVNGEELSELELRPARERYPVELPLVRGENAVQMRFRYAGDPNRASADHRRLAVAFYRFDVLPEGETPVRGKPGPFSWVEKGLQIPAGGRVTVYADVSGEARLRLTRARPAALHVRARTKDRILFDHTLEDDELFEQPIEVDGAVAITLGAGDEDVVVRPELFVAVDAPRTNVARPAGKNIVLVILDGANALRTGLYGYGKKTTPVLDALGRESVVYETAVSQAVYTIASIGSLLTGQYPERHQSVSFADKLGSNVPTLPRILAVNGYRTAGFSGNAVASKTFGLDRGYQEFFQVWERADYTGHGDSVLDSFESWLEGLEGERFFASVHFREPHFPYNPPPPFDTRFGPAQPYPDGMADREELDRLNALGHAPPPEVRARVEALYDGNLAYVDHLLGKLVSLLDEDTILIVTADHGEALFEHGFLGHNTQLYEESIRVPLVLKIPGVEPRRVPEVVELIDLTPTILAQAGIEPADMEGRNLLGPMDARRVAFSRTVWTRPRYSARDARFKLIWDSRTGGRELYDLVSDSRETDNVVSDDDFVAGYLEQRLLGWLREQEHLRAGAPAGAVISEREREILRGLGYLGDGGRK